MSKKVSYVAGVDFSTQNEKCVVVSPNGKGKLLAVGSCATPMIKGEHGEREGKPEGWRDSFQQGMAKTRINAKKNGFDLGRCLGICPSGMMHGEVLILDDGSFYELARLWCDNRNKAEAEELTNLFQWNTPQRLTISRWLWTIRNRPDLAKRVIGITTPAGAMARFLGANKLKLGLGEACGMFKIDPSTLDYDRTLAAKFDELVKDSGVRPILQLLPKPVMVGDIVGHVDEGGAKISGLLIGTPIFSPEGDQPTTLAGTYSSGENVVCLSGGTSICHNLQTHRVFPDIFHPGVEPFMAADGTPFLMCHVQNGTSAMNIIIDNLIGRLVGKRRNPYDVAREEGATAPVDCGGLIVLPTIEPEHGLGLGDKAEPGIFHWNADNFTPGNLVRATLVGSMFSVRWSVEAIEKSGTMAEEIIASGGVCKYPWGTEVIAGIFNKPVREMGEATNCSPYGAALMAIYGLRKQKIPNLKWREFLEMMRPEDSRIIKPKPADVQIYNRMFEVFRGLAKDVEDKMLILPWVK